MGVQRIWRVAPKSANTGDRRAAQRCPRHTGLLRPRYLWVRVPLLAINALSSEGLNESHRGFRHGERHKKAAFVFKGKTGFSHLGDAQEAQHRHGVTASVGQKLVEGVVSEEQNLSAPSTAQPPSGGVKHKKKTR